MCGIFGWQFRPNYRPNLAKRAVIAAALGRENVSRGKDSWGWYASDTNEICHGIGSIAGNTQGMAFSHSLIGHTRHATTGAISLANAHPYEMNGIVGAHNGIIGNHKELNDMRIAEGEATLDVDSMHLIDAISRGLDYCLGVVGYGAVEWVELKSPGTVKLCRLTSTGDLRLFMCKEGILWSSTKGAIESAVADAGLRGFMFDEPQPGAIIDLHNGVIHASPDKLVIGEQNRNYMGFSGSNSQYSSGHSTGGVYGSQGSALVEQYRAEQIRKGEQKREERKAKKALGRSAIESKTIVKNESILKLCQLCLNEIGDSGKCAQGHDCSAQSTLVLDV